MSEFKIELDGPNVSPGSVDAPLALELAAALLGLVQRLAVDRDSPLEIRGLSIEDKCVAVVVNVHPPALAKELAQESLSYIRGDSDAPRGAGDYVKRARAVLKRMPTGYTANVMMGRWRRALTTDAQVAAEPWSRISQRVKLVRVGGQRPIARFESRYDGEFSLSLTVEAARRLGGYLYRVIDIDARVLRDAEGAIERGELVEWHVITDEDPVSAWRDWVRENAATPEEIERRRDTDA